MQHAGLLLQSTYRSATNLVVLFLWPFHHNTRVIASHIHCLSTTNSSCPLRWQVLQDAMDGKACRSPTHLNPAQLVTGIFAASSVTQSASLWLALSNEKFFFFLKSSSCRVGFGGKIADRLACPRLRFLKCRNTAFFQGETVRYSDMLKIQDPLRQGQQFAVGIFLIGQ